MPFLHGREGNTFVGHFAGSTSVPGAANTGVGVFALQSNTGGINNSAFGAFALATTTVGSHNAAFGGAALNANTVGSNNSAFGNNALIVSTTGEDNSAFGANALFRSTEGRQNSAFGSGALLGLTNGESNIAVGVFAGGSLTSGSNNIYVGSDALSTESDTIRIGSVQTATFIAGIAGATSATGVPVFVDSAGQLGTSTSSRRHKLGIVDIADESAILAKLRPVAFYYRPEYDSTHTRQYGLIAEEVAEVAPHLVTYDRSGAPQGVRYHFVNAMLVNEFQKQRRLVEEQRVTIARQQDEIRELAVRLAKLEVLLNRNR